MELTLFLETWKVTMWVGFKQLRAEPHNALLWKWR